MHDVKNAEMFVTYSSQGSRFGHSPRGGKWLSCGSRSFGSIVGEDGSSLAIILAVEMHLNAGLEKISPHWSRSNC